MRLVIVEPPAGIEPATSRLQGECSGQLSYRGLSVAKHNHCRRVTPLAEMIWIGIARAWQAVKIRLR
jgi:hypothetical protein